MEYNRSAGILLHPTSFPSKFGIGDLGKSAYHFVDFLKKSNQKIWQILPLGHTSFGDSPYQSFSTFAGNPLLISPDLLLEDGFLNSDDFLDLPNFSTEKVAYGEVITYKNTLYKKAYENFKKNASKKLKADFTAFCKKNADWLDDYSLFVSLKNYFIEERKLTADSEEFKAYAKQNKKIMSENTILDYFYGAVWNTWPSDIAKRTPKAIEAYQKKLQNEINYYDFLQYIFFSQWDKLKAYANENEVQIIGDIPIFVSIDSADTWANPSLFHLDKNGNPTLVAGVPPDYFSATGQLWGNPLYDWNAHQKTEFTWWIKRIESMLKCVDIIRIDHFRGFEAYWAIPFGEETAVKGTWQKGPNKDLFIAIEKALGKLPIIAEDLGFYTKEVADLRDYFGFPGMKILQFAFDTEGDNEYLPHNFNQNTICYSGTHDNDTTIGWYSEATEHAKDYLRRYLNVSGDDVAWDLIRLAYSSVSIFAIVPLQDVLNLDTNARMNTPGVASGNWQFRYNENMLTDDIANRLVYLSTLFYR